MPEMPSGVSSRSYTTCSYGTPVSDLDQQAEHAVVHVAVAEPDARDALRGRG